jgi:hypothetical protein
MENGVWERIPLAFSVHPQPRSFCILPFVKYRKALFQCGNAGSITLKDLFDTVYQFLQIEFYPLWP